jgi:predicted ATP-grasp superfamily ATP-dependent carboligase
MTAGPQLLLFGASVRAAAYSAARAGLRPWCADLFADTDLQALCPAGAVPAPEYPHALLRLSAGAPPGPWMYTGALENRPRLIERLARLRPLWGNGAEVLRRVRSPFAVAAALRDAGLACPAVRGSPGEIPGGRWLTKPLAGAGGRGIAPFRGAGGRGVYFQEYVEGTPCSAVYVGDGARAVFLGATRQLVGETWLHATPFRYCGSVGPLPLGPEAVRTFRRLGDVLAAAFSLRGLFGVDCVLRDETPWPVEVNPRYTASVELLEYACAVPALALHRRAFDRTSPEPAWEPRRPGPTFGKAILFARAALVFPGEGYRAERRRGAPAADGLPDLADIPPAGQVIAPGRPVLTFFATAGSEGECLDKLRVRAVDLDRGLFGR